MNTGHGICGCAGAGAGAAAAAGAGGCGCGGGGAGGRRPRSRLLGDRALLNRTRCGGGRPRRGGGGDDGFGRREGHSRGDGRRGRRGFDGRVQRRATATGVAMPGEPGWGGAGLDGLRGHHERREGGRRQGCRAGEHHPRPPVPRPRGRIGERIVCAVEAHLGARVIGFVRGEFDQRGILGRGRPGQRDSGRRDGRRRDQRGARLGLGNAQGQQFGTGGRGGLRIRRRHHGYPQRFGKPLGDKRYGGTAADRHDGCQLGLRNPVALQRVDERRHEEVHRMGDHVVEFRAGQPHRRMGAGQRCRGVRAEAFLGATAQHAQVCQRGDRRCPGRGEVQSGHHVPQHELVDEVAGEVVGPHGVPDHRHAVAGVDQGDAAARRTEIAQHHHTAAGQATVGADRGQRGDRIGHHGQVGHPGAQRRHGRFRPVGGSGDRRDVWPAVRPREPRHRLDGAGRQPVGVVTRAVGGHQRDGIADAVDEAGE